MGFHSNLWNCPEIEILKWLFPEDPSSDSSTGAGPKSLQAPHLRYPIFLPWDARICTASSLLPRSTGIPPGSFHALSTPRADSALSLGHFAGPVFLERAAPGMCQSQQCGETAVVSPSQQLSFLNSHPSIFIGQRRDHKMLRAPLEGNTEC